MLNFLFKHNPAEPKKLFYHTDIHCHINPGVDHGAEDPEKSFELLDAEKRWGIDRIVLTSHVTDDTFENTPETLKAGFDTLTSSLRDAGRENDFSLAYSAEYRIDSFFLNQLENNMIKPFPDGHLLIENSYLLEPIGLDTLLFKLQTKGYSLILAHPERYPYYHPNFKRYTELHERGIQFQANLLSFSGYHGKDAKIIAEKLAKEGMVDYLGSDLHHSQHVASIDGLLASKYWTKIEPLLKETVKNDSIEF